MTIETTPPTRGTAKLGPAMNLPPLRHLFKDKVLGKLSEKQDGLGWVQYDT